MIDGPEMRYVRSAAAVSIGLLADRRDLPKLAELAGSEGFLVRAYAVAALGWLVDKDRVPATPRLLSNLNYRELYPAVIAGSRRPFLAVRAARTGFMKTGPGR